MSVIRNIFKNSIFLCSFAVFLLLMLPFANNSWDYVFISVACLLIFFNYPKILYRNSGDKFNAVKRFFLVFKHPFTFLILFICLNSFVKEHFPFSNIPMYGNLKPYSDYLYLAERGENGELKPLPCSQVVRLSSPKIKKKYRTLCHKFYPKKSRRKLNAQERDIVGTKLLKELAERYYKNKDYIVFENMPYNSLPRNFVLVYVFISKVKGKNDFSEEETIIASLEL